MGQIGRGERVKTYTIGDENGEVWNGEEVRPARGSVYEMDTLTEAIQIAERLNGSLPGHFVMEWDSVAELGGQVWPKITGSEA